MTDLPHLIGITGRARHGKDSVASVLISEYGFERMAFSDALKEMAWMLNPIVENYNFPKHPVRLATLVNLLGWEKTKERAEVRRILQVLGTECVRDILGEDSWVGALERRWLEAGHEHVVIPDVRFPNEAAWIHRNHGVVWRVQRYEKDTTVAEELLEAGLPTGEFATTLIPFDNGVDPTHSSEALVETLDVDAEIKNSGTLEDLQRKVDDILHPQLFAAYEDYR